jgi:hypothetical protein
MLKDKFLIIKRTLDPGMLPNVLTLSIQVYNLLPPDFLIKLEMKNIVDSTIEVAVHVSYFYYTRVLLENGKKLTRITIR